MTRSAEGALVVSRAETRAVPAFPVERVVDTTGAGDLFAAGFLAGLTQNLDLTDCARLGGLAAAEIISHLGARPQADLRDLARQEGLSHRVLPILPHPELREKLFQGSEQEPCGRLKDKDDGGAPLPPRVATGCADPQGG